MLPPAYFQSFYQAKIFLELIPRASTTCTVWYISPVWSARSWYLCILSVRSWYLCIFIVRSWYLCIFPLRPWYLYIFPARSWYHCIFPARSWHFCVLPARSCISVFSLPGLGISVFSLPGLFDCSPFKCSYLKIPQHLLFMVAITCLHWVIIAETKWQHVSLNLQYFSQCYRRPHSQESHNFYTNSYNIDCNSFDTVPSASTVIGRTISFIFFSFLS